MTVLSAQTTQYNICLLQHGTDNIVTIQVRSAFGSNGRNICFFFASKFHDFTLLCIVAISYATLLLKLMQPNNLADTEKGNKSTSIKSSKK